MVRKFEKPRVVVSRCIEFDSCRYNGLKISSDVVKKLRTYVDFTPICPEVEVGLGVPREPIRIITERGTLRLVQPATGRDVTNEMLRFAEGFLGSVGDVEGFILKSRSPSCGIKDVKVYRDMEKGAAVALDVGFFGGAVLKTFPHLPVEDEGRLTNFKLREHFLTRLYTLAGFRRIKPSRRMGEMVRFHTENKLLFMAYNQKELKILGRIVANLEKVPVDRVFERYESHLHNVFLRPSRYTSNVNVMMHALGYFSKGLSHREKSYFLDSLERYRSGKIPLSACLSVIRAWVERFEEGYLMKQSFFEPFPEGLVEISDSGKGRKL